MILTPSTDCPQKKVVHFCALNTENASRGSFLPPRGGQNVGRVGGMVILMISTLNQPQNMVFSPIPPHTLQNLDGLGYDTDAPPLNNGRISISKTDLRSLRPRLSILMITWGGAAGAR